MMSLTPPSGMYYELSIRCVVTLPSSSNHDHFTVPILMLVLRVPPDPIIDLLQSFNLPIKSVTWWDMHPEHQLSMPTGAESVSNVTWFATAVVAASTMTGSASVWEHFNRGLPWNVLLCLTFCLLLGNVYAISLRYISGAENTSNREV